MKIGIDIRPLMDAHYSGVALYTLQLLQALFAIDQKNTYHLYYNSWHDVSGRLPKFDYPNVYFVKTGYPNKLLNYGSFRWLNRPRVDKVVGGVDLFFMPHFNFIAFSPSVKKVITIHDVSFLHYPYFFSSRHNIWHRSINVTRLLQQFDNIITVSENTKRDLMERCDIAERRIHVVYSGIDKSFHQLPQDSAERTRVRERYQLPQRFILYIGNLEPRKNVDGLIDAYTRYRDGLRQSFITPEAHEVSAPNQPSLVIAGAQSWKYREIFNAARNSRYASDIHFLDYADEADKPALYNLAEVFVFPSFYEGFGFPPLEAAACGTPVIAANTASLPEVLGDAAVLVNPYDSGDIARALDEVLSDKTLQQQLRADGMKKAGEYRWEKTARQMLEVFERLS